MKNNPRPVFYISAITIAHQGQSNIYYVHTNDGTSVYYCFDDPETCEENIWNNACYATSDSPYTTIICDGGVICA